MSLVLIHAQAPCGPISLRTAGSMGEVLAGGRAPAAVVDVGERDPADVVREALRLLPPPMDATGLIPATVDKARNSVAEAILRVSARVVADVGGKAAPGQSESHGGPIASDGEAEPAFSDQHASARDADNSITAANDSILARARRRPGAEIDAREIRTKLGMSQPAFAAAFGLKLAVLRDWEQGRTKPEGASRVLLMTIAHRPDVVQEAALAFYGSGM